MEWFQTWAERAVAIKRLTPHDDDDGGRVGERNLFRRSTKEVHVPNALADVAGDVHVFDAKWADRGWTRRAVLVPVPVGWWG